MLSFFIHPPSVLLLLRIPSPTRVVKKKEKRSVVGGNEIAFLTIHKLKSNLPKLRHHQKTIVLVSSFRAISDSI